MREIINIGGIPPLLLLYAFLVSHVSLQSNSVGDAEENNLQ
jgi:hypothetical protein